MPKETETADPKGSKKIAAIPWHPRDTQWMLTLFGTAVGAGVLFLPINAGLGGIWPLIAMTLLIGPMTFLAHRGLARFCLSSSATNSDITHTVTEHFGHTAGNLITAGYFLAIFPILLIYGIGITNTVNSLLINQLGVAPPPRALLSLLLVSGLAGIMVCGQQLVLKICSATVYPLIIVLVGTSLYLIPQWNMSQFDTTPTAPDFFRTLFLTIPVLVFSFNHSPAISSFASAYRKELADDAESHVSRTLKRTSLLLVGFTMLFVYSCVLTLSPTELASAKTANLPILSIFAERTDNQIFGWLAQIVALTAITSSFFGHYMGTREGLYGLISKQIKHKKPNAHINKKWLNRGIMIFITLSVWITAYLDLSVMTLIESAVAPIIAIILFIMPIYATRTVPAMKRYQSPANIFTLFMGTIAIVGFVVSQLL